MTQGFGRSKAKKQVHRIKSTNDRFRRPCLASSITINYKNMHHSKDSPCPRLFPGLVCCHHTLDITRSLLSYCDAASIHSEYQSPPTPALPALLRWQRKSHRANDEFQRVRYA